MQPPITILSSNLSSEVLYNSPSTPTNPTAMMMSAVEKAARTTPTTAVISPTKTMDTAFSMPDDYDVDVDVDADADVEVVDHPDSDTSTLSLCQCLRRYATSHNGKELVLSCFIGGIFLGLCYLVDGPHERPIPYQLVNDNVYVLNLTFNNPFEGDTIPDWAVVVIIAVVPLLQLCVAAVRRAWYDVHAILCITVLSLTVNDFATWMLKAYAGYFRPSFYQMCQPNATYEYCQNEDIYDRDAFPSGHASFSFMSMTLLYLYLERTIGLSSVQRVFVVERNEEGMDAPQRLGLQYLVTTNTNNTNTHKTVQIPIAVYRLSSMACAFCTFGLAAFVSTSRVVDNRHHPADIVAGGILGSAIAYFLFSLWFTDVRFDTSTTTSRSAAWASPKQR